MTLVQFRTRWPEMNFASDVYIQAYLDAAALRLDPLAWGNLFDEGHGYLAAHMIAITPSGFASGLSDKFGKSGYSRSYGELLRLVAGGARVL